MKMTGTYAGVADTLFMYDGQTYCMEFKNAYGEQSEKQKAWQKTIENQGFPYYIIRDLSLFKQIIQSIVKDG